MKEYLEIFDEQGNLLQIKERNEFYMKIKEDYRTKGKINQKIRRVLLILLNSKGKVYLQLRSKEKKENPGLYDKSVGGHVYAGESYDVGIIRECVEELGIPITILNEIEFGRAINTINLSTIGIAKRIAYETYDSMRIDSKNLKFIQPYIQSVYIGYYDGPIFFGDSESNGVRVYSLSQLERDIKKFSNFFTQDIKYLLNKYKSYFKSIRKLT